MGYRMYKWKSLLFLAIITIAGAMTFITPCLGSNGTGSLPDEFTNESLKGNYVFELTGGFKYGIHGVCHMDGNGIIHCLENVNLLANGGGRVIGQSIVDGAYTVSPEGFVTAAVVVTTPIGTILNLNFDFVIAQVEKIKGQRVATELFFIQREVVAEGNLLTGHVKRLGNKANDDD